MTTDTELQQEPTTVTGSNEAKKRDLTALWLGLGTIIIYLLFTWLLPVTDPVESNYALTAKEMVQIVLPHEAMSTMNIPFFLFSL